MMTSIKKIFSSRLFYIVFSILASLTIWMYVEYIENPDVSVTLRGIKVAYLHEDYVTDRGLVITNISADTVSARFTGKRNIISQLTNTNLSATVDLSEVDTTGQYQLPYTIILPGDTATPLPTVVNTSELITVKVDKLAKKDIPVKGTFAGSVAEGYQAEPIELTPNVLTVSGPQQVLSTISYAWISVDRDNISKTMEESLRFILMDETGHEVISDKLTFSSEEIRVKIPVVMVKAVPLKINLTPGAGADETNTVVTYTPSALTLSGDASVLKDYNQILLGTIDLSRFLSSTTQTFEIILPNGTTNLTGITTAQVTVTISGLESKHFNVTNIQVANVTPGYTATIITTNVDVVLRGRLEALSKLTPDNIRIVADLTELGETTGGFNAPAKVYVDGDAAGIGAVGEYRITVLVTKD